MVLNNHWVTEKNQRWNYKQYLETKQKHSNPNSMEHSKSNSKREVYDDTSLPQETREKKIPPNLTLRLKEIEKEQQSPKLIEGKKSWIFLLNK